MEKTPLTKFIRNYIRVLGDVMLTSLFTFLLICIRLYVQKEMLCPGQTDRQVVASGRKLDLRRDMRWVAKL